MHRLKAKYEQKNTTTSQKQNKEPRDPFAHKQKLVPNPKRLTNSGTFYRHVPTQNQNGNVRYRKVQTKQERKNCT